MGNVSDSLAGTTGQDGGEQPGTPVSADGNESQVDVAAIIAENEKLRAAQAQALAEKSNLERLKRENEELRSRTATPPMGYGTGGLDPQAQSQAAFNKRMNELAAAAAADPGSDAAIVMAMYAGNMQLAQELKRTQQLISVPFDEQAEVQRIQREMASQGENISAATAKRLLEAERLASGQSAVKAKENELRRVEEAKSRNVVATRTAPVTASEAGPVKMTYAEFGAKYDSASPAVKLEMTRKMNAGLFDLAPE